MNPIKNTYKASLSIIFNRSIIKKRNRMSDTEDSYKISIFIYNYSDSFLISLIIII